MMPPMRVMAKNAKAGERYFTQQGSLIEVRINERLFKETGQIVPYVSKDKGVYVSAVRSDGTRQDEYFAIPFIYWLNDGRTAKNTIGRRGPMPRKVSSQWRGWAWRHAADMDNLLAATKTLGLYAFPTIHYFKVGHLGVTICGIFRAGHLGFNTKPQGILGTYPVLPPEVSKKTYLPHRISLTGIFATGKWNEMYNLLVRHMKEQKHLIEVRAKRGSEEAS